MWLALPIDPGFVTAVLIFIFVLAYFWWLEKREKEKALEERLRRLEEQQANRNCQA